MGDSEEIELSTAAFSVYGGFFLAEDVDYTFDFNENVLSIKDAQGNEIRSGDTVKNSGEKAGFTITRKNGDQAYIGIDAESEWGYISRYYYMYPIIEQDHLAGDVNRDGTVNGLDLVRLKRYLAGYDEEISELNADVNADGKVDGRDAVRLKRYLAGYDTELR